MNFFYFDQTNQKRGPVSQQQLKELAARGIIGPHTPLETDGGHKGVAGQIAGLFSTPAPPPPQPVPVPPIAQPPIGISFDAQQRKARIHLWTMLCLGTYVASVGGALVMFALNVAFPDTAQDIDRWADEDKPLSSAEMLVTLVAFLWYPAVIAYLFCFYFYLRRLWEEIPGEFARTTPGKAAGFMLVPLWNVYWMFIAFWRLYTGMNNTSESYGFGSRFNESLILKICVGWLVLGLLNGAMAYGGTTLQIAGTGVVGVLYHILTIWTYWFIRKDVLEFIDFKASVGR
ncbi:MAG: DUF4339 domain-containing protein [Planctomycetaceae bacterium]|nr:DUF4339 domain-containing protein [Planctomycetaceae bacterium]